jgi:hypothetical protein
VLTASGFCIQQTCLVLTASGFCIKQDYSIARLNPQYNICKSRVKKLRIVMTLQSFKFSLPLALANGHKKHIKGFSQIYYFG